MSRTQPTVRLVLAAVIAALASLTAPITDRTSADARSVIVLGDSVKQVVAAVHRVNGKVAHELPVISAVSVTLSARQPALRHHCRCDDRQLHAG